MSPVWGAAGRILLERALAEAQLWGDCLSHGMHDELCLSSDLMCEHVSRCFYFQHTEALGTLELAESCRPGF